MTSTLGCPHPFRGLDHVSVRGGGCWTGEPGGKRLRRSPCVSDRSEWPRKGDLLGDQASVSPGATALRKNVDRGWLLEPVTVPVSMFS
jgi:hypothetical protein